MRTIFSDSSNSVAHFLLGAAGEALGKAGALVTVCFIVYQVMEGGDNMQVDLLEFFVGYLLASFV